MTTTFVALLRGINVGGHNKVPMAALRGALTDAGLSRVRTYIQSGNVVLEAEATDAEVVAARVRSVIATTFHLDIPVIALTAADLDDLAAASPFLHESDPRRVHAIVLPTTPSAAVLETVALRAEASAAKGSRDRVQVVGRTAYLHTPDGFGTSDLAKALCASKSSPLADGTARNWATITTLVGMAAE